MEELEEKNVMLNSLMKEILKLNREEKYWEEQIGVQKEGRERG